jgi:hypothetical protein
MTPPAIRPWEVAFGVLTAFGVAWPFVSMSTERVLAVSPPLVRRSSAPTPGGDESTIDIRNMGTRSARVTVAGPVRDGLKVSIYPGVLKPGEVGALRATLRSGMVPVAGESVILRAASLMSRHYQRIPLWRSTRPEGDPLQAIPSTLEIAATSGGDRAPIEFQVLGRGSASPALEAAPNLLEFTIDGIRCHGETSRVRRTSSGVVVNIKLECGVKDAANQESVVAIRLPGVATMATIRLRSRSR